MNTKENEFLLKINDLHVGFMVDGQLFSAIDHITFRIDPGKTTCVVGESGCGKSVMALSIMDLLSKGISKRIRGEIIFGGRNLTNLSDKELTAIRGKEIGMIFQEPMTALNPVFTIGFQVREALLNHIPMTKKAARIKSINLLKQVGISSAEAVIDRYPHQLSGGMRQRVMIAIAIACHPKLLIADEPTTALDVSIQAQLLELLIQIQRQSGMAMLLITHDLGIVAEMADEVIVMYAGQIVEQGDVHRIFHDPKHPYLQLLLQAIPRLDVDRERFITIKGNVPSITNRVQSGCRFAERCPQAAEICFETDPLLADTGDHHYVRCLLYADSHPASPRMSRDGGGGRSGSGEGER